MSLTSCELGSLRITRRPVSRAAPGRRLARAVSRARALALSRRAAGLGPGRDDGKPLGAGRDVAVLAAQVAGHGGHVGRPEYHADRARLGATITVNLVEHAHQPGIAHGGDVV